jgi:hypothetical protein
LYSGYFGISGQFFEGANIGIRCDKLTNPLVFSVRIVKPLNSIGKWIIFGSLLK